MKIGQLRDGTRSWLDVEATSLNVLGRLAPRFKLILTMRTPTERIKTVLKVVQVDLLWNNELLGSGIILEEAFSQFDSPRAVEIPTTRRFIQEVTDRTGPQPDIAFQVRFNGSAEVTWQPGENDQRFVGDPDPGEPKTIQVTAGQNTMHFSIPRSDWFSRVVAGLGEVDYLPLELFVPRSPAGDSWRQSIGHLDSAEKAYALGDDPSVFVHLRGALDALPGAKQHIFDSLPEPKRTEVDKLATALGQFLHKGRHVSGQGADQGTFPVDHIDAGFALNMMKVLLSYTSRTLEAAVKA